jgi:GT2 family glycosyltransferase
VERTSVVIATRDRPADLDRTLDHLERSAPCAETIVVDNASVPGSLERVRRGHRAAGFVHVSRNVGCGARTIGARLSARPFVAFSDDDSWWAPGALDRAEALFDRHARLGAIAATVLVGAAESPDPVVERMRAGLDPVLGLPGVPVLGFLACGLVVRREAYLAVGGFDARFGIGGEERLLALDLRRAGWAVQWVEDVVAHHHPSTTRDPGVRSAVEHRNHLWTAWLRRPASVAVGRTLALALRAGDATARRALVQAVLGLPWVLRARDAVPRDLERAIRRVDRT